MEQGEKLILQNTYWALDHDIFKSQLLIFLLLFVFFFSFGLISLDQFDVILSFSHLIDFQVQNLNPTEDTVPLFLM